MNIKTMWIAAALLVGTGLTNAKQLLAEPPELPFSDRVANYRIEADAEPDARKITGTETVTWTNRGSQAVKELYFHMYPNAFKDEQTTFMRERKREDPWFKVPSPGKIEIASIIADSDQDLAPSSKYVQPDDENPSDETLLMVPLQKAVSPGGTVKLDVSFKVTLPSLVRRMGIEGDFLMAGQWFPKLAVYETAGMRGRAEEGWNLHQYHANSEFYSDFGAYRVAVRLPEQYEVAGSGRKMRVTSRKDGRKEHEFYAPDVHDFAWSASPHFVKREATTNRGVIVHLYLDPKHVMLSDRYESAATRILNLYDRWFGAYPYPEVTLVVPPEKGRAAGSMEYPNLVMLAPALSETPDLNLERIMAHELAHQYWYGVVANNEAEEPWLDEGFAAYAEEKVMRELLQVNTKTMYRPYDKSFNLLKQAAWKYKNRLEYVNNSYIGGKHVLQDIEASIGEERMFELLRTYKDRWQFRHPGTQDFIDVLAEVSGRSWRRYFASMHAIDDNNLYADGKEDPVDGSGGEASGDEPIDSPDSIDS